MRVERALNALGAGVAIGAPLIGILVWWWGALALALGLLALALLAVGALAWTLPVERAARFADASMGLHAAADTALHLHAQGHPAAEAVALDALDGLRDRPLPPLRWPVSLRYGLASAAITGGLVLALSLRPEPPPQVVEERSEAMRRLDALEDEARRRGQTELVEAVRELKQRLQAAETAVAAREIEPVQRRAPEERQPEPPPPPAPPEPKRDPTLPDDISSPEQLASALREAEAIMSTDDVLLAELTAELERHLMQVTEFQDLGHDMLAQTLLSAEEDHALSDFRTPSAATQFSGKQRSSNQMNDFIEQGAADLVDAAEISGMRRNEMDDAGHELVHALQQSYKEFLNAYAEALRDELLEALQDAAKDATKKDKPGDGIEMPADDATAKGDGKTDLSDQAEMISREAGSEQAAQTLAQAQGKGKGRGQAEAGSGQTTKGGVGAGSGQAEDGEGQGQVGEQAGGSLERLEGQLNPGALTPAEREAMLEAMSRMAVSSGPNDDFGDPWQGYFDEVERALVEEDLHPMMEGVVRAYFAGLRE